MTSPNPARDEAVAPCPFCGGPAKTFQLNGTLQASCAGDFTDCAGFDVTAPVAMWNRRVAAKPPASGDVWQTMESAPRDGRWFAIRDTTEYDVIGEGAWWIGTARFDRPTDSEPEMMLANGYDKGPVWPTHWAPLEALSPSTSAAEPVAFMAYDQMRAITQRELDTIPEANGRRSNCKALYPTALYATPPAPAAVDGQRVKALVWNEYETEGEVDRWDAETALGTFYEISTQFDGYHVAYDCTHLAARFDTLDEAKAAAQADYEARIRACLANLTTEKGNF